MGSVKFFWSRNCETEYKHVCANRMCASKECAKWHSVVGIYKDERGTGFVQSERLQYTDASGITPASCRLSKRAEAGKKFADARALMGQYYNMEVKKRGWTPEKYKPRHAEVPWKIT